jgi:hypothetical protein
LQKGEFKPQIQNIKYFFDRAENQKWTEKELIINKVRGVNQKEANRKLLQKKINEKRTQIQEKMNKRAQEKINKEKETIDLDTKNKNLLKLIEKKLNEKTDELKYAEAGITGSEFFKKFNEEQERIEKNKKELDPENLGNKIEAYLNRQKEKELEEFAILEHKVQQSNR